MFTFESRTGGNRDAGPVLSASLLLCMAASPLYESPTCSSAMGERRATVRDLAKMFTALSMGEIAKVTKRDPKLSI